LLKNKVIFDGRYLYDLQKMIDCGFYYNSIGRKIAAHPDRDNTGAANGPACGVLDLNTSIESI
jgi:UDPglucose 6-dehydrogenase